MSIQIQQVRRKYALLQEKKPSFLHGMFFLLNLNRSSESVEGLQERLRTTHDDWVQVGKDLDNAIERYKKSYVQE